MIQICYDLKIDKEGENICLYQMDNEGCLHKIVITPSMTSSLTKSINEMSSVMVKKLPSERESSAKEKEFPSFAEMKPVQCTVDDPNPLTLDDFIQLTEDLIRQGMTNGIGINKKQQEILGVESLHKGWMQDLIGKSVNVNIYNQFLALKGASK